MPRTSGGRHGAFFLVSVSVKPCFLRVTPARSSTRATPRAGAIAHVHPGVPPARRRQHRAQIKSTATAPSTTVAHSTAETHSHTHTHAHKGFSVKPQLEAAGEKRSRHIWLLRKSEEKPRHQSQREQEGPGYLTPMQCLH